MSSAVANLPLSKISVFLFTIMFYRSSTQAQSIFFFLLSGPKETPIPKLQKAVRISRNEEYRSISGSEIKASIPHELVKLVQKESFPLPPAKGIYGFPVNLWYLSAHQGPG